MTKEELYEILTEVDDRYLMEAEKNQSKKKLFIRWGSIAACFAAVFLTVIALLPRDFGKKEMIVEDQAHPVAEEEDQQEEIEEHVVSINQIHMNLMHEAVTEEADGDGKMYYDPELYDEIEWGKKEMMEYYGEDLTPAYIPEGLTASVRNDRMTVYENKEGKIVQDLLWMDFYHDYFEDGSPKMTENVAAPKGVTIKASKAGFHGGCDFLVSEEKKETSCIDGTEVLFGGCLMSYGPYDPDTHEPSGYYDLYVAEFQCHDIYYQVMTKQLKEEEIVKVVSSIIYGEEVKVVE